MINDGYRGSFRNCGAQTFADGSMHPQPPASDDQWKGNPNMASFERLCYPGASVIVYAYQSLAQQFIPTLTSDEPPGGPIRLATSGGAPRTREAAASTFWPPP